MSLTQNRRPLLLGKLLGNLHRFRNKTGQFQERTGVARRPSQQQLTEILSAHQIWLQSSGRPDREQRARLQGADLRGLDFGTSDLTDAILEDTDLRGASLKNTQELQAAQLAGADLSRAKLPEGFDFHAVDNVKELSQLCLRLYISLLLVSGYALLTTAATTDSALLSNSASARLPVFDANIAIVGFFYTVSLLLLGLYTSLHIHLQKLWEQIASLPLVFPDGTPWDERVYPSIFTSIPKNLTIEHSLARLQRWVFGFTAWWFVPVLLVLLWARCLTRQDGKLTAVQVLAFIVTFVSALSFRGLAQKTLRAGVREISTWATGRLARVVIAGLCSAALAVLSFGSIWGVRSGDKISDNGQNCEKLSRKFSSGHPRKWSPLVMERVAWGSFAKLERFAPPVGADLAHRNLRYAVGRNSSLVAADLSSADLECADLFNANLRKANLEEANLEGASLIHSQLDDASLSGANLKSAILEKATVTWASLASADLRHARLSEADLTGADFKGADLTGANLTEADLNGADFTYATLRGTLLRGVKNPSCSLIAAARSGGAVDAPPKKNGCP